MVFNARAYYLHYIQPPAASLAASSPPLSLGRFDWNFFHFHFLMQLSISRVNLHVPIPSFFSFHPFAIWLAKAPAITAYGSRLREV